MISDPAARQQNPALYIYSTRVFLFHDTEISKVGRAYINSRRKFPNIIICTNVFYKFILTIKQ